MALYPFYVDEKVTTWKRTRFDIEAESFEKAKEKAKSFVESEEHIQMPWNDIDGIIPEIMTVEENGNQSTIEIFSEDGEQIYTNGEA